MDFTEITLQNIPWVYSLRFNSKNKALLVDFDRSVSQKIDQYFFTHEEELQKIFKGKGYNDYLFVFTSYPHRFGFDLVGQIFIQEKITTVTFLLSKDKNPDRRQKFNQAIFDSLLFLFTALKSPLSFISDKKANPDEPIQVFEIETNYNDFLGDKIDQDYLKEKFNLLISFSRTLEKYYQDHPENDYRKTVAPLPK